MITKAIVETVINPYSAKVRIPFYNKAANNPTATTTENLCTATICTIPNSTMNYAPGDVVFVGFEDNLTSQPVILGQLCRETKTDRNAFIRAATLEVNTDVYLPTNTSIGGIKPEEIRYLNGVTDNIQHQLDLLQEIKTSFFIQSYMPVNPYPGDIWIPSENYIGPDGRLYIKDHMYRYSMDHEWLDVSTSAQAQLAIVIKELEAINSNLSGNVNYTISATEPEYKKVGDIWKDISTNPPIYKRYVCIDPENEIYDWVEISEEEAENRLTINTIKLTADSLETLIRNEVKDRQTAITQTENLISFEAQAREVADNDLIQDYSAKFQITADTISQEVENRINGDAVLRTSIETTAEGLTAEIINRANADNILQNNINITAEGLTTEINNRQAGDNILDNKIKITAEGLDAEILDRTNGDIVLDNKINVTAEGLSADITKEIQDREIGDQTLQNNIDITAEGLHSEITKEIQDREQGDQELQTIIDITSEGLSTEVTNRINGDTALQTNLDITASEIRTELTNTAENLQTNITTTAGEIRTELTNTASGLQTQITANTEGISTKVSKNSIISEINQSPEEIKIDANRVTITGFVTFEDLSNSGSTIINGDNITTGTISADRINMTGAITWDDLTTNCQNRVDSGKGDRNPSYIKSTYIDSTTIKSPTIEANEFNVRPTDTALYSGSYNIYGRTRHLPNEDFHFFQIGYFGAGDNPTVTISSPASARLEIEAAHLVPSVQSQYTSIESRLLLEEDYNFGSSFPRGPVYGELFFLIDD